MLNIILQLKDGSILINTRIKTAVAALHGDDRNSLLAFRVLSAWLTLRLSAKYALLPAVLPKKMRRLTSTMYALTTCSHSSSDAAICISFNTAYTIVRRQFKAPLSFPSTPNHTAEETATLLQRQSIWINEREATWSCNRTIYKTVFGFDRRVNAPFSSCEMAVEGYSWNSL